MTDTAEFGRFTGRMPDVMRLSAGLAVGALAVEPIVGTVAALGFLLSGCLLMALRPVDAILDLVDFRWLLILPLFCIASAVWSGAPAASLRAGIQLLLTVVFAIAVARRLPPGRFLIVVIGVLSAIVALSIATGTYRTDTGALTGYFASKNAMGAAAAFLSVAAAGFLRPTAAGGVAAMVFCLGAGGAVLAQSMGALVAMAIGVSTYPVLAVLRRLSFGVQIVAALGFVLSAGLLVVLLIANIDAVADAILSATGKDITLTGRTDLWRVALDNIAAHPWLGQGYQAFWQPGNPGAEELWRAFGIESRTGFHFHNLFLSNAVELGLVGVAVQSAILLGLGWAVLRLALASGDRLSAAFLALTVMVLSMTPLEVPAFFPFNLQTFVLIATLVYARDGLVASRGVASSGRGGISTRV
jgi:exopolysaccharide production protein ExoQ